MANSSSEIHEISSLGLPINNQTPYKKISPLSKKQSLVLYSDVNVPLKNKLLAPFGPDKRFYNGSRSVDIESASNEFFSVRSLHFRRPLLFNIPDELAGSCVGPLKHFRKMGIDLGYEQYKPVLTFEETTTTKLLPLRDHLQS